MAQTVKNLPAMGETWVRSLGWEEPGEGNGYTPVLWSGGFHGLHSPWGRKESDTQLSTQQHNLDYNRSQGARYN